MNRRAENASVGSSRRLGILLGMLALILSAYVATGSWRARLLEESARSRRVIAAVQQARTAREAALARERELEATLRSRPGAAEARLELARLRWQAGGPAAAVTVLDAAPSPWRDPRLARMLAAAQRLAGREDRALATLEAAVRAAPTDGDLQAERALLLSLLGWFPQASAALRQAERDRGDPLQLALARATLARQQNDSREARRILEAARQRYPEDAELTRQLAAIAETEDRPDEAARLWESLSVREGDPDVWVALGRSRLRGTSGDAVARARAAAEQAVAIRPGMAAARLLLARCRRREGNRTGALQILEPLYAERPRLPGLSYELAQVYRTMGRSREAAEMMARHDAATRRREVLHRAALSVMARPGEAAAHRDMGRLCLEEGRIGRAIAYLERAAALDPRLPGVVASLARARAVASTATVVLDLSPE